ncbi:unnamed protein product [Hermetia illucens]|uniref:Chitin-binding type-2 domain-containing protein n=1 Tax=Hermetia illucens TaxID=343691 RepID=A0A7R8YQU3_HERIL|nr:cell wall integrity and stress response component 2-like [Hermetia illucens]CAD7082221.1 unnamed protein product [Hermetia illucens]
MLVKLKILFHLVAIWSASVESVCIDDTPPYEPTNGAVCTSITTFVFVDSGTIPDDATPFTCAENLVCADEPEICVSASEYQASCATPAAKCNDCSNSAKYACVSENTFAVCVNGEPLTAYKQSCPSNQYCGFDEPSNTTNTWPCTNSTARMACSSDSSNSTTTTTTTTSSTTASSSSSTSRTTTTVSLVAACDGVVGSHPVASDTTCKSYFYCYNDGGVMKRSDFTCPGDYVFNSVTKRCVLPSSFTCAVTTS